MVWLKNAFFELFNYFVVKYFSPHVQYRLFEMIPGFFLWTTLIGVFVISILQPIWAIYFVILFDFYWLVRVTYFVFYLLVSWRRYRNSIQIPWLQKLQQDFSERYASYFHIIFFPFFQEDYNVVRTTFEELCKVHYDFSKFIIVLGGEERAQENALQVLEKIRAEYAHRFGGFIETIHPDNLEGEMRGKGANANFMGRAAQTWVTEHNINPDHLIVSYFDIDTITHPEYFSYLTYQYLSHPSPNHTSFQPVALFNNNIWESNPITRVAAFGTTFWLLTELARPERLYTFSSHSMSWRALVDVGFWQKDIVTDDSRIFLQCLLHYDGDYETTPLYMSLSMDTVDAPTLWQSLKNLYKQQRRWAWGVEHFPYLLWNFFKKPNHIPFLKKLHYIWNLAEGMYSWATVPLIIFVLGRLPMYFLSPQQQASVITQNAPFVLELMLRLAMIGIFVSALVGFLLLPPRPVHRGRFHVVVMLLQWALIPVTLIFFGSFPAIEAQTRLMLGKYLGFFNTPKRRTT